MNFQICWSNAKGKFGWTDLEDCENMDDAIDFWMNHLIGGKDVPIDAEIEQIRAV
jgi:hypothetical protein